MPSPKVRDTKLKTKHRPANLLVPYLPAVSRVFGFQTAAESVPYDILTVTASELRLLLDEKRVTSTDLVRHFLRQIQKHNKEGAHLNCINSLVPEQALVDTASDLDRQRAEGRLRSPYHGIPFVAKDSMWTAASFSVPTTAGAFALKDATARSNADVIQAVSLVGLGPSGVVWLPGPANTI